MIVQKDDGADGGKRGMLDGRDAIDAITQCVIEPRRVGKIAAEPQQLQ
jgi:hypothetical protein